MHRENVRDHRRGSREGGVGKGVEGRYGRYDE